MQMVGWSSSGCANVQPHLPLHPWKPIFVSSSSSYPLSQSEKKYLISINDASVGVKSPRPVLICAKSSASDVNDSISQDSTSSSSSNSSSGIINVASAIAAKGSGTTARGRRLLRIREEKRKREYDRLHNYPAWAKVLEDACKEDTELRAVLGDSIGDPELMRKRVEERVRMKGRDFRKSKTGSVLAFKVSFRE